MQCCNTEMRDLGRLAVPRTPLYFSYLTH